MKGREMLLPKKIEKPRQRMSVEEFKELAGAMKFPKKKWKEPQSPTRKAEAPESALQEFADGFLKRKKLRYLRFPDGFLAWMKLRAPIHIKKIFFDVWAGRPDNTFFIEIGNGYELAVPLELKTQDKKGRAVGRLHGKQKNNARDEKWFIARSTKQIVEVVEKAEAMAQKIKKIIDN